MSDNRTNESSPSQQNRTTYMLLVLLLLTMITTMLMFWRQSKATVEARGWVTHTYVVIENIELLFSNLMEASFAERGFIITGQEEYLTAYNEMVKGSINQGTEGHSIAQQLHLIRELTADNPVEQHNIADMENLVNLRLEYMGQLLQLRKVHGINAVKPELSSSHGKDMLDHIRAKKNEMIAEENRLLTLRTKIDQESVWRISLLIFANMVIFYAALVFCFILMMRHRRQVQKFAMVTSRHALEVEKVHKFLKNVINCVADPIFVKDSQHRLIEGNQAMWQLFGRPEKEILGKSDYDLFTKDEADVFWQKDREVFNSGKININIENFTDADGMTHILSTKKTCFTDADGNQTLVGTIRDITEEKETENKILQYTKALERSNEELDNFAYAASHDLKAPLRVIDNTSKWLEEDLQQHLTDETRENLNLLRGRVKRMEKLLDDLLEYSRIGKVSNEKYFEIMTGMALMDNILILLSPPIGFTVKVSPNFARIHVCRMPLQQILMNLISNAIKHHDKKTGIILVTVEDTGLTHTFSVKDDGPGIPAQFHAQIFKMFQTLKSKDQVEGSGMGLAMVKKSVEVFGGTLHLESAEGLGSIFSFTWPKQQSKGNTI